ncbi:carotenoid oxygenase family protein [Sorangium sp. So ce887]|uniref:carotenoid oxygenase family protein n=1 Tax=Sorangium sp. So ce887 TaxID=3133324 RepID=UPI003F5F5DA3
MRDEDDFELSIAGEIPREIAGVYYRNGPNPQFEPRGDYHLFIGDGMVHAFSIADGAVRYRNRFVRTPRWEAEHAAGRALFGSMDDPGNTDPSVAGIDPGVANTNIVWHGNKLLAMAEGSRPFELDPDTLAPRGYLDAYRGNVTAHPKLDAATKEMVWFAHGVGEAPFSRTMSYGVTSGAGAVARRDNFEAPYCSLAHDFVITQNYVLFPVLPVVGDLDRVMRGGPAYAWEPDRPTCVGVLPRNAEIGAMRWFSCEARHFYHPMNAWEEGDTLYADLMEFPRAPLIPGVDGQLGAYPAARFVRWRIDLSGATNTIGRQELDDLSGELPRFDERYTGRPYRHGWYLADTRAKGFVHFDTLVHLDLRTGARSTYEVGPWDSLGEPLFIPRSASSREGDGWVIALARRGESQYSELLVFDAIDIRKGPIGTAKVPRLVPMGFHGNWRPA